MSDQPKLFIVAGVYREADYYARHRDLGPHEWTWVRDSTSLRGIQGTNHKVIFTGTFAKRRDAEELLAEVKQRELLFQIEPELFEAWRAVPES